MSSTYAPLPFSYLSTDAKPKVGLRKDGVYGTSADVRRVYQPETQDHQPQQLEDGSISLSTDYPNNVYANANGLNPDNEKPMPTTSTDRGIYSQGGPQRFQDPTQYRPQKPEGGYLVYPPSKPEDPYGRRIPPKEAETEATNDDKHRGGIAVVKRPPDQQRSNVIGMVPSYYPPERGAEKHAAHERINDVETPNNYAAEAQQKHPAAMTSKDFDNFILVKDPNRPESDAVPQPISTNNDRGKNNNLQTLFEADEPRKPLPRYKAQPPKTNNTDSGPSNAAIYSNSSRYQETEYDKPNDALYVEPRQIGAGSITPTISEAPIDSRDTRNAVLHPDSNRSSETRLVKDSEAERKRTRSCACGKCSAVIIAVIITAIVCLGAGFVAGWFGAKASGSDAGSSPSQIKLTNQSTVTFGGDAFTKASAILTTKASAILTTKSPVISITKAVATSQTTKGTTNSTTDHSVP